MPTGHRDEPKSQRPLHLDRTLCILWALSSETEGQHMSPGAVDTHALMERQCKVLWSHIAPWPEETGHTWVRCLHNERGNLVTLRERERHFVSYITRVLWFQSAPTVAILHEEGENNNKENKRIHTARPSSSSNELYLGSNTFGPPVVSFHSEKTWTTTCWVFHRPLSE